VQIHEEKDRHLRYHYAMIHTFSEFRIWWKTYMIYLCLLVFVIPTHQHDHLGPTVEHLQEPQQAPKAASGNDLQTDSTGFEGENHTLRGVQVPEENLERSQDYEHTFRELARTCCR
jgi:hypothetical protein